MTEKNDARWERTYQTVGGILLTICLGLTSWVLTTAIDNRESIAVIQASRFSSSDARKSEMEFAKAVREVWIEVAHIKENMAKIPVGTPEWLRLAVSANTDTLKELVRQVNELEKTIVATGRDR